jgi:4-amino-4-deoxy-L-arabinose transferase-like glycosyltransferase
MTRDSTTYSETQPNAPTPDTLAPQASRLRPALLQRGAWLLAAMAAGALLLALAYQLPVTHQVDIGGYDAAYVQGFYDPDRASPGAPRPELDGSDGSARWTRGQSFLVFPQAGLPAELTLRLRGWRPAGPPPEVTVLLNGARELGRFQASQDWQDHRFTIDGGLLKPNDVVIEIRSDTAQVDTGDSRAVGVLLDRATLQVGPAPIVPYPPQLLYGALAAGMLWLLCQNQKPRTENRRLMSFALLWFLVLGSWFFLYRAQPAYPYPLLRLLPAVDGVLAALLALRYGPALARRVALLPDLLAVGAIGAWLAAVLVAARDHLVLSVPSMEKDFRVFALRSAHLAGSFPAGTGDPSFDGVLRADGFYNLGYPLMLWLIRPLASDNPFLAARLIAALSGALLLASGWWLARRLLGRGPALLALLALALSPLVVEHALYVGTDMPFAALCALAIVLLVPTKDEGRRTKGPPIDARRFVLRPLSFVLPGIVAGAAFLVRHPGLLLLPFGILCIALQSTGAAVAEKQSLRQSIKFSILHSQFSILAFTLAFLITITPQLYVNLRDTGAPLYSEQAKNIWQAVFGDGDWGRWGAANNTIGLGQVIAQDPGRFLANWWNNLRGFVGTGGEDTREFGQAAQLRLLGFPANWLAVAGLLGWLLAAVRRQGDKETRRQGDKETRRQGDKEIVRQEDKSASLVSPGLPTAAPILLVWIALYILAISVGLPLQGRFLLPLAPIYALAAAWALAWLTPTNRAATEGAESTEQVPFTATSVRSMLSVANHPADARMILAGIVLLALLWGGFGAGANYVLRAQPNPDTPGQPADALGIAQLALGTLRPGERLIVRAAPRDEPGQALGKYSALAHLAAPIPATDDPAALRASGARYLIWSSALGPAPGIGPRVGASGIYSLYRVEP